MLGKVIHNLIKITYNFTSAIKILVTINVLVKPILTHSPGPTSPIENWNKLGLCTFSKRCLKVVGFTGRGLRSFEITVVKGHRTIRVRTGSQPFENLTQAPVAPSSGRGVH